MTYHLEYRRELELERYTILFQKRKGLKFITLATENPDEMSFIYSDDLIEGIMQEDEKYKAGGWLVKNFSTLEELQDFLVKNNLFHIML